MRSVDSLQWEQMAAPISCFFLEPTDEVQHYLRRYVSGPNSCPDNGYHDAMVKSGISTIPQGETLNVASLMPPTDDERWPTRCICGYEFTGTAEYQLFSDRMYRRTDTGEVLPLREASAGACWFANYYLDHVVGNEYKGPDGNCLIVRCPNGGKDTRDWMVDSRCSNCTRPDDNQHKCWCRHGIPPMITVDKSGDTCSAGAGSILLPNFHGFLRDGKLIEC